MPKGREYQYATKKQLKELQKEVGEEIESLETKVETLNFDRENDFDEYLNDPETGSRAIFKDHDKRLKSLEKKSRNFKR